MPHKDPHKLHISRQEADEKHRATHKEEKAAYDQVYYLANKEKRLAQMHVYDASHKKERRLRQQQLPQEKKTKIAHYLWLYRLLHKKELKKKRHLFYLAHKGQYLANNAKRRTRLQETIVNDLTHAQWVEIQETQQHRCYYCGKRYKWRLTQDHIVPLIRGGGHTLHNVIGACKYCNSRKHKNPPPIPVQPLLLTIASAKKKPG